MAVRRRKDLAREARVGDIVKSVAIGRRAEFIGRISAIGGWFVNVRDATGGEWHRSWGDLRPVSDMIDASHKKGSQNV